MGADRSNSRQRPCLVRYLRPPTRHKSRGPCFLFVARGNQISYHFKFPILHFVTAHHVLCENIGDHEVLGRIARRVGMNEGCVISKLAAGDDEDRVKKQMHLWLCKVFRVCPYSLSMNTMAYQGTLWHIREHYGISGAQSAESLASTFDQLDARQGEKHE